MQKHCVRINHEDEISNVLMASINLHNMCIGDDSDIEEYLPVDEPDDETDAMTIET